MKKYLSLVILIMVTVVSFGQTEKGKVAVSGASDLNFSALNYQFEYDGEDVGEDFGVTNFNIKPTVSYFVIDNLAIGLAFNYQFEKIDDYKENSFMFGPTVRYYIGASKVKPYVQADVLVGNSKADDGDEESKSNISGWDLGAGVAIFLNDFVSIDLGLGYASLTETDDDDDKFKLKAGGVAFTGGFSVYF
ncbi:outer membrane beta-barrel protein [Carboxylicivirga sp. RSCT41]|uniref:outer membrane beta-barrel protein n=1 Tax=Carboxylicivirga agarovorans TaxID=3417570 RepID=UPI003D33C1CB